MKTKPALTKRQIEKAATDIAFSMFDDDPTYPGYPRIKSKRIDVGLAQTYKERAAAELRKIRVRVK